MNKGVVGIPLAEFLPDIEALDEMAKRTSGKSLHEWDAVTKAKRIIAVRRGFITTARPLTVDDVGWWIGEYGFSPDEFECKPTPVSVIRMYDPGFRPPMDRTSGRSAEVVNRWFLKEWDEHGRQIVPHIA